MSAQEYIKAREEAIARQNSGLPPKEGDTRTFTDEQGTREQAFYQGKWTECYDLPKDHDLYIPF